MTIQVYRVTTTAVAVNVSVTTGSTPVSGLTMGDFAVTDQGVAQTIDTLSTGDVPIDVSLVVDVSGSTAGEIKKFQSAITAMVGMLRPVDRAELISFASEVHQISAMSAAASLPPVDRLTSGNLSSIYDAIAIPLMGAPVPGRRRLIVAFTDGIENRSVLTGDQLIAIAQRSEAALHLVTPSGPLPVVEEPDELPIVPSRTDIAQGLVAMAPMQPRLKLAVEASGGSLHLGSSMVDDFRKVLNEFRSGYLLTFRPTGVSSEGWHELTVKVTKPGRYRVQARRGYFAGGS